MFSFDTLFCFVGIFLSIAFLTLAERKFMGYCQSRKGPGKVSFLGLTQPFSDVTKLFFKSFNYLKFLKVYFFMVGPFFGCFLMLLLWIFYVSWNGLFSWVLELMLFFSLMSLTSYFLFFCGFSNTSVYSVVGFVRSITQVISYEVNVIIFLLCLSYSFSSLSFFMIRSWSSGLSYFFFLPFFLFVWVFVSLSESNRSPFDFSEGESELVSGFNVEYFGGSFSVIFVVEYGLIIFMSYVGSWYFFGSVFLLFMTLLFSNVYLWSRSSFPRFRYDKLMEMSWVSFSPLILAILAMLVEFMSNV